MIAATRPSLLVELGTHWGQSYFAFCQSVFENGGACTCYAVDHWLGEEHAGFYGEEVFQDVQGYNDAHYRNFSYLLRNSFDDSLLQFADETIDLLHIDGLHTYDAVKHDFDNWLPKVRPGGIILLHDIAVRHADFGVWRFWLELESDVPETFAFHHGWGLGLLRKPGGPAQIPSLLKTLFESSESEREWIRRHYVLYAAYLHDTLHPEIKPAKSPRVDRRQDVKDPSGMSQPSVQLFPFGAAGYSEDNSFTQPIEVDAWQELLFELPQGTGRGPVRIDPSDCPSLIEIGRITVSSIASGTTIWAAKASELRELHFSGSMLLLPSDHACLLLSYGTDPRIALPVLDQPDEPARVEISLRIRGTTDVNYEDLDPHMREGLETARHLISSGPAQLAQLEATLREATSKGEAALREATSKREAALVELRDLHTVRAELRTSQNERMLLTADLKQGALENSHLRHEIETLESTIESVREKVRAEKRRTEELEEEIEQLKAELKGEQDIRAGIMRSVSWRLTAPARSVMLAFKK